MKKWLKRIRGALGMGLTWAAAWFPVGAIIGLLSGLTDTRVDSLVSLVFGLAGIAGIFAAMGFVGGAAFSTVLGVTEGRRRFDEMSLPRFAAWGAVGGLLLSGLGIPLWAGLSGGMGSVSLLWVGFAVSFVTLLGAGSASGSLTLARRAEDRELLEDGADVADIGLTEEETRELLGK